MKKIVIIGAGPAGLTAAYTLLNEMPDVQPVIVESSDAIGGIARTINYKENRIDIGGHRFFSKDERVMDLWQKILPPQGALSKDDLLLSRSLDCSTGGPDPEKEDACLLVRHRFSRIYYLRKFFNYPISISLQTIKNLGLNRTFKSGMGYVYSSLFKRKENSLEDFYINRFGKPLYQMFFKNYTEKVWGKSPNEIAADWGKQRVKGLSLSKALLNAVTKNFKSNQEKETSLIEKFFYPKFGCGQIWEHLAKMIQEKGGKICFNKTVSSFQLENGKITTVVLDDGTQLVADYVFSSMPIKDLIDALPDIPSTVKGIADGLPYRDFITVALLLSKLTIKNKTKIKTWNELIPDTWIYVQDDHVKLGRIQIFNNWSPYMVKDFQNSVWLGLEYFCSEGDELWNKSAKDFIQMGIQELSSIGVIDKKDVLDAVQIKQKKAYPAYFGTYAKFDQVRDYLNSILNLYCIGRNGQHRYNNMDHSMLTAIEAVSALKNGTDKTKVWNVNTEQSYHEEKIS